MADIHVEEFYKDVAVALVQLYSVFPRRTNLFVEDVAGPDEPDEFGLHSPRHMACFGALLWLEEEGLLRYVDTIRQEALDQAVLTQKAFVRLSTPAPAAIVERLNPPAHNETLPPSVKRDLSSYVHLLKAAIRSGNSDKTSLAVQSAFFAETLAGHFH